VPATARKFGASKPCIAGIAIAKNWGYIAPELNQKMRDARMNNVSKSNLGEKNKSAKLDVGKVREIRKLLADGQTLQQVADRFGVRFQSISSIKLRKTWAHSE
jgi:hypothetical protein